MTMNNDELKLWLAEKLGSEMAATLIAGFVGGILAVAHQKGITFFEALVQVASGLASAYYGILLVQNFIELKISAAAGFGFVFGLTGMYLIGGILTLSKKFLENPQKVINDLNPWKKKD